MLGSGSGRSEISYDYLSSPAPRDEVINAPSHDFPSGLSYRSSLLPREALGFMSSFKCGILGGAGSLVDLLPLFLAAARAPGQ